MTNSTTARKPNPTVQSLDPAWTRVRAEALAVLEAEPTLAGFILSTVINQPSLDSAIIHRVASRMGHPVLPAELIAQTFHEAVGDDPTIPAAFRADLAAIVDRDAAVSRFIEPMLHFKGFHAIQVHRLAHWLWGKGRTDLALYIQSRSSEVFQTDIHPAAKVGRGVFLDHATGLVVGQTAVIGDNVSLLHGVTLGGTGKEQGDRHPKIRSGVMLGAGATVLGNIEVGECARVAAGSVVLAPVPRNTTVAGVPAKVIGEAGCAEPARRMDQLIADLDKA